MKFTEELQEILKTLCDGETKIIIDGFNALGDPFTTKGKISKGDNGNPVVYDDVVYIDFGIPEDQPYSDWVAPFETEFDPRDRMSMAFIIGRITLETGEVLYENADAEKYFEAAKENMKAYKEKAEKEGRWIEEQDGVSKEMMSMLARPIVLDGNAGVLAELPRLSSNYGSAMLQIRKTSLVGGLHVRSGSTLEKVDLETGEVEYVVSNKEYGLESTAIIRRRAQKVAEAKANGTGEPGDII